MGRVRYLVARAEKLANDRPKDIRIFLESPNRNGVVPVEFLPKFFSGLQVTGFRKAGSSDGNDVPGPLDLFRSCGDFDFT